MYAYGESVKCRTKFIDGSKLRKIKFFETY